MIFKESYQILGERRRQKNVVFFTFRIPGRGGEGVGSFNMRQYVSIFTLAEVWSYMPILLFTLLACPVWYGKWLGEMAIYVCTKVNLLAMRQHSHKNSVTELELH